MKSALAKRIIAISTLILSLFLIVGCAGVQTTAGPDVRTAQRLSAAGDHAGASRVYLDLAVTDAGDQRQRYMIFSASELYLANDLEGADRILSEVDDKVTPANLDLWAQVKAQVQLARGDARGAYQVLERVTSTQNPATARSILLLRANALFMLNQPEPAVVTMLQREAILNDATEITENRRQIWTGLQATGDRIPPNISERDDDAVLTGWLQVAYLSYANRASVSNLRTSILEWQTTNPSHPASIDVLPEVLASLEALTNYPSKVAMLVPLSGKQKTVGAALRDGYLSAHFSVPEDARGADIQFYDTARNGVAAAYQQAVFNGATFIVGPLLKGDVQALAELVDDRPVLALNFGPEDIDYPARFYQFALAPEDEARAVGLRAAEQGQLNAVALVPPSAWGDRVLAAFQDELENNGGTLLASQRYATDTTDFADVIRDVLLLDESYQRRNRLAANIGKDLEFTPRRRQDVDLVFIAANASTAKLLRPQLRFHYAADLPTYATSAIYKPGSTDNTDLNGVIFPDMPWLLQPTQLVTYDKTVLKEHWGKNTDQWARLYAMGYDAYHLSAVLNTASRMRSVNLAGMTGDLYMGRDKRLHRRLTWAKMERGKPRTLPPDTRSLTQDIEVIIR